MSKRQRAPTVEDDIDLREYSQMIVMKPIGSNFRNLLDSPEEESFEFVYKRRIPWLPMNNIEQKQLENGEFKDREVEYDRLYLPMTMVEQKELEEEELNSRMRVLERIREKNRSCWMKAPGIGGQTRVARILKEESTVYTIKWRGKGSIECVPKKGFTPLKRTTDESFQPYEVEVREGNGWSKAHVIDECENNLMLIHWVDEKRTEAQTNSKIRRPGEGGIKEMDSNKQLKAHLKKSIDACTPGGTEYGLRKAQLDNSQRWIKFKSGKKWWPARLVKETDEICKVKWYGRDPAGNIKKKHSLRLETIAPPGELQPYAVEVQESTGWTDAYVIEEFQHDFVLVHWITEKRTEVFPKNKVRTR